MTEYLTSAALLLVLLNPFLVIIYLTDLLKRMQPGDFTRVLIRAGLIASAVFCSFAILGDAIFSRFMQADFASFQIFGGIVFLLIGLQFVFQGPQAIAILRGDSQHVAGAIAMPVLIGPGTISASVVIGKQHAPLIACAIVVVAVFFCLLCMALLKKLHDYVLPRREALIDRYIEIAGRITALFVGTIAVEMLMQGTLVWAEKF